RRAGDRHLTRYASTRPHRRRGREAAHVHRPEREGRGRPAARGLAGHQAQDGDRHLPGRSSPARPPGAPAAHAYQRAHPQGPEEARGRQEAGEALGMAKPAAGGRRPRRRERKNIAYGTAHIKSSFNNTIISIADQEGNVSAWASAGNVGFKGSRKSTPFAAQLAAETAARRAMEHGVRKVDVV